jgi:hypothetical protein
MTLSLTGGRSGKLEGSSVGCEGLVMFVDMGLCIVDPPRIQSLIRGVETAVSSVLWGGAELGVGAEMGD